MHSFVPRLAVSALLAYSAGVFAASVELAGQPPYAGGLNGVESDGGTPPYAQSFTAPANSTLDKIVWWGYRLNDQSGGAADNFDVRLGGVMKTGALTVALDGLLQKYTLDIADEALTANLLSIQNDVPDFEWYWQGTGSASFDDRLPFPVAFSLIGTLGGPGTVPEPDTLALFGVAGLGWMAMRRRRTA